jgi:hypothetical protein
MFLKWAYSTSFDARRRARDCRQAGADEHSAETYAKAVHAPEKLHD